MKMRAVSTLCVADPALWTPLLANGLQEMWLGESLSETCRIIVEPKPLLVHLGGKALERYARRPHAMAAAAANAHAQTIARLPKATRSVLHSAQRHARDNTVVGLHAWDPQEDAQHVRILHGAGLLMRHAHSEPLFTGRYRLPPDLPSPPPHAYDFSEAIMEEEEADLSEPRPGLIPLMHDLAALAAAILQVRPKQTHTGTVMRTAGRRLGRRLGDEQLSTHGDLQQTPRWNRALRALHALNAIRLDRMTRTVDIDIGLEATLQGDTPEAVNRLTKRLVDRDQHVLLPAVRTALQQARDGCVDTVVFCELLQEQHRDVLFPPWRRDGQRVYPHLEEETCVAYDDTGFERVETPAVMRLLRRLERMGLVRLADGVFAGTEDGRIWSGARPPPRAQLWVGSDLELIVPPESITPWERFQLERLSRCLMRDVVDRYALDREGLLAWLAGHDLDEAIALLQRRCPGVPNVVVETLRGWERAATQVVVTHGVLLEDP